jgi:CO/xanthine dehydrogenase Mo-binding subunit
VTGRAQYAYDIRLPGQLYARVLRSPHPHARIRRVDTSRAEAVPGVHAMLSVDNAPDIDWYEDGKLFEREVTFIGDEVAAVAAESEEVADDALRLIQVDYDPLPFVTEIEQALRPDAPRVRQNPEPDVYQRGDVETGFREAEVIVERSYQTQTALHNCLEPHGCTAAWDGADHLTLWDSTQSVFQVRTEVAAKLGLPEHHLRVISEFMGGGFGSKQVPWKHTVIAALLARRSGRPVQLMLDREAENLASGNRNPTRQHVRLGARRDGTLTAIQARLELAMGAHKVGGETSMVDGMYQSLYRCPNVRTELIALYTNTGPAVAFRAPGFVEGAFGLESSMDELARELGIDPIELRLRNYTEREQKEDRPYTRPDALRRCIESAAAAFGWHDYQRPPGSGPIRRGIGFAAHDWIGGAGHPPGYAWVKLNADGSVDVVTGTQDIGTGTRTGLSQIAADELGAPLDRIELHLGDTASGPYAPVSSGSATQATIGPAIREAALDARKQLLHAAAGLLEVRPEDLRLHGGEVVVEGAPGRRVSVQEVVEHTGGQMILGQGSRGPNPPDKAVKTFGAQCVEVEVDVETGEVRVVRVVAAHDCGRVVNRTLVDSQVIGAVTQGLGFALLEERVLDPRLGLVLNPNLEDYKVPTLADVPRIQHAAIDLADYEANPTGAKGIGEPPLVPTAPAIANAVFDAVGVRLHETPLSSRRLLEALA